MKFRSWQFRLWHLLLLVTLACVCAWAFTQIGKNSARFEILETEISHDQQWDKYWSKIKWKIHLPEEQKGQVFTSFIEVEKDFDLAGYVVGDVLRFRYQEHRFFERLAQDPKQMIVNKLFGIDDVAHEDEFGGIYAGPYPTVKKEDSDADWE